MSELPQGKPRWWRVFHEKFVVEERYMEPKARTALYRTATVLAAVGLAVFIAALIGVTNNDGLAAADKSEEQWLLTVRSEPLTTIMIILAVVFGPVALPVIILAVTVAWSIFAKHAWRPLLLAAAMLTGVILAQVISRIVGRQRPPLDLMLFGPDGSASFPSGHGLGLPAGHHLPDLLAIPESEGCRDQFHRGGGRNLPDRGMPALPGLSLGQRHHCLGIPLFGDPWCRHRRGHLANGPHPGRSGHRSAVRGAAGEVGELPGSSIGIMLKGSTRRTEEDAGCAVQGTRG